jgi:hypothetical protein
LISGSKSNVFQKIKAEGIKVPIRKTGKAQANEQASQQACEEDVLDWLSCKNVGDLIA